ncbi:site-specific integrase [Thiomicrorhabdus lithotrophica]|uniref:Integrase n=1 Tax=Thiomicrorhabdus lithotrophica TaxID=2949997 RepID=A0ABY8C9J7_9GAMM|nr:hypothetical protein [Thiomicrorhabdus lithotrophica]WEJ62646.1 hypothetical protein NR989_11655 [Thiomicrorhabdus lithotrophica]
MAKLKAPILPQIKGMPEVEATFDSFGLFQVDSNTIISLDEDGKVLSRYGDNIWIFESKKENLLLHFDFDCDSTNSITDTLKAIQFALLHTPSVGQAKVKNGFNRQRTLNFALRAVAEMVIEHDLDFREVFSGKYNHFLEEIMTFRVCTGLKHLTDSYVFFRSHQFNQLVKLVNVKKAFQTFILEKYKELETDKKPTLPIPERLYLMSLNKIQADVESIDQKLLSKIFLELKKYFANPLYGISRDRQKRVFHTTENYRKLLKENNWKRLPRGFDLGVEDESSPTLQNLIKRLDSKLSTKSIRGLFPYLTELQRICFRALVAYSGGRLRDIAFLTTNALQIHKVGKKTYPLLYGEVQKGAITDEDVEFWVTNEVGEKAFNIAKEISNFIHETSVNARYVEKPEEERLLFVSRKLCREDGKGYGTLQVNTVFQDMELSEATINEDDRVELIRIDPSIDLDRDDLAAGSSWWFTAHQFRRTLAIYAMASGAVSIPSLRRQLRHIGEAMTLYYSGGSCAASNIIDKSNSFAKECKEAKSASTAIALHKFVASDEKIFGGMGRHLDKNPNLKSIVLNQDTTETQKMVERGELAWSETALGGCGETGNCDYRPFALTDTSHCKNCDKAYHKISKMDKTIHIYEISLSDIPVNTRQHKWREKQIDELKQLREVHMAEVSEI